MNTIDRLKALEKAAMQDRDVYDKTYSAVAARHVPALLKVAEAAKAYHDMATSRYDSSRVAEFERKQDALGEALAELEAQ